MTRFVLDVASYQGDLLPADVKRAGFTGVNLKVSHGLGTKSVHPELANWVLRSRELGLGISTFHYFTADAPGVDQAEYAYRRLTQYGLTVGTAHQLDVESTPVPALAEVRAYLEHMTELLARPVILYTGDWWWTARTLGPVRGAVLRALPRRLRRRLTPRRAAWNVADLTPYLWAAPNDGSRPYPGDTSSHWNAGYGGWPTLSAMQYTVDVLRFPDGTAGTIKVSKTAIRDETVWRDLTLGRPGMSYAPANLKAARAFYIATLKTGGYTIDPLAVGIVGDDSHANAGTSYHLGDDALKSTAYSIVESSRDRNGLTDAAAAVDYGAFSLTAGGKSHNLRTFSAWLVAQCKAGTADTADIREVIYSLDGSTVKRWDRLSIRSTGDSSHTTHTHVSYFRDSENRSQTALLKRYFTEIGVLEDEDMPTAKEVVDELFARKVVAGSTDFGTFGGVMWTLMGRSGENRERTQAMLNNDAAALSAIQSIPGSGGVDPAAIVAGILQGLAVQNDNAAAEIAALVTAGLSEDLAAAVADEIGGRIARAKAARHAEQQRIGEDNTGGAPE